MNIGSEDGAAFLLMYLSGKISSVFIFSPQFLCQLISFCLTGVTGVLFAGLSGSDYQRLKFSSTSTFDSAHINLHTGLSRSLLQLLLMQRTAEPTRADGAIGRGPSPPQTGFVSTLVQVQIEGCVNAAADA